MEPFQPGAGLLIALNDGAADGDPVVRKVRVRTDFTVANPIKLLLLMRTRGFKALGKAFEESVCRQFERCSVAASQEKRATAEQSLVDEFRAAFARKGLRLNGVSLTDFAE
ncbi:MAG: hypothetical protein HY859_16505 [Caulobacterales bacterium]|nr:hypothetical protein [Caulobacterales bacterium]